jgi:hypothetical protein
VVVLRFEQQTLGWRVSAAICRSKQECLPKEILAPFLSQQAVLLAAEEGKFVLRLV